ncbi:MAG TPA: F0F1 ATP synthase subunit epsilon [Gammaproteobacteria bacterium]|nr:F0F1 ATP synthase subunit epsilon [Gammaproteobacteria bacterium]
MMATIHVNIVSATEAIFDGDAEMVFAPAEMGEVGILPRHAPLLTRLRPGAVRVRIKEGEEREFFVTGGLLEVQPDEVSVLADTLMRAHDLDEQAALEARVRAEENLAGKHGEIDLDRAREELIQAEAQLRMIEELRGKHRS